MPRFVLAQLVLLELAAAAALGGLALGERWRIPGYAVAAVLVLLAAVPVHRRWSFQLALSWVSLVQRRRGQSRRPGLAGLFGEYSVETVSGGSGSDLAVVRSGTTWCLPLVLGLDGVFNDDAGVPVDLLAGLLQVEDVPLSSVRLFTLTAPAQAAARAPAGPSAPLTPLAARYCLLTLDTRRAADAVAGRGGSGAAVHQMLRRCAVHAEQVLSPAGLKVRRLGEPAVRSLFATWMGPAVADTGRHAGRTRESWGDVRVAGTWSTVFAVTGSGADVADRVSRLAAAAPTPIVATALVLRPGGRRTSDGPGPGVDVEASMVVRLSAPDSSTHEGASASLGLLAKAFDLVMQRLGGEQAPVLRATTPLGLGEAS